MPHTDDYQPERRPITSRDKTISKRAATWLVRRRVTPNAISVAGMIAGLAVAIVLPLTVDSPYASALFITAAVLMQLRLLANMLDGMVAVETGISSAIGELYNEMPDRISDAAILIGVGYAAGGSSTLGYIAVCVALFVAYVRSAVKTAGAPSDFCGPMAKQQRMLVVAGAAVFMGVMPFAWQFKWGPDNDWGIVAAALLVVIVGGLVTAVRRVAHAVRSLGQDLGQ